MVSTPAEPLKLGQGSKGKWKWEVDGKYRVQDLYMDYIKNEIHTDSGFFPKDVIALEAFAPSPVASRIVYKLVTFSFGM